MAEIKPFSALIYNQELIDIQDVVTPPYDLISQDDQLKYYQLSPYNIVRLILGKELPHDDDSHNKYMRAAEDFKNWQAENILINYPRPALYLYRFDYKLGNYAKNVMGFIALVRLAEFDSGKVLPHEKTFAEPKADRLKLMKSSAANLDQVFSIFSDESGALHSLLVKEAGKKPLIRLIDKNNVTHTIWPLADDSTVDKISKILDDKTLFIADGHHRYETALNYAKWRHSQEKIAPDEPAAYDFIPMLLVDIAHEQPELLPTHRILRNLNGLSSEIFIKELERFFQVEPCTNITELSRKMNYNNQPGTFGLYLDKQFYLLTITDLTVINENLPKEATDAWKSLDASIWQFLVKNEILNIKKDYPNELFFLRFSENKNEAVKLVDNGEAMAAFLLNPTKIEQVKIIAENNEKMPQKSTYFYPKPMTGLILNLIDK